MIEIKEVDNKKYKVINDTWYSIETKDEVINILENTRLCRDRIRLFYGDNKTGEDWLEDCDVMGRVGRGYNGIISIPILVKNSNSIGGTAILTDCIVKMTINKKVVYQQDNYYIDFNKLSSEWEQRNIEFFKGNTNRKTK